MSRKSLVPEAWPFYLSLLLIVGGLAAGVISSGVLSPTFREYDGPEYAWPDTLTATYGGGVGREGPEVAYTVTMTQTLQAINFNVVCDGKTLVHQGRIPLSDQYRYGLVTGLEIDPIIDHGTDYRKCANSIFIRASLVTEIGDSAKAYLAQIWLMDGAVKEVDGLALSRSH